MRPRDKADGDENQVAAITLDPQNEQA